MRRPRRPNLAVVGFLAPGLLVYTVFMVLPLLDSLRRSLLTADGAFAGLGGSLADMLVARGGTDTTTGAPFVRTHVGEQGSSLYSSSR